MSNELTTLTSLPLAINAPDAEIRELEEAIAMNSDSGGLSEFDLGRITIAPGAFKVPTANGTTLVERIDGVVVYMRMTRAYYKSKDQGSRPPDCSSKDCITGVGDPGGRCVALVDAATGQVAAPGCPLAAFESALTPDGKPAKGQACKQTRQLFLLRGESLMPVALSIPPTSLAAARKFFNWMIGQGISYPKALISITIQNAKNGGQEYGTAVFHFVRKLTPEESASAMRFHTTCSKFLSRLAVDAQPGTE